MKILLLAVNAKYIHTNPAIYALRQYALQHDSRCAELIVLREYTINHELDAVLKGIYEVRPEVLCISCYLWNIQMVQEIAADYRKIDPQVSIYLGGPEVSYDAADCLGRMPEVKGIMAGEGEGTFLELVRCHMESMDADLEDEALEKVCGMIFRRRDGTIQVNPGRELLDFSRLPFPYADMENLGNFKHKIIYYETSRGCPFSCSYCLSSVEKLVRFRDWDLVRQELQFFLDNQVQQVKFVDRTFNCNKQHAMRIWQYILEHDNGITNFHFEIAADLLDEEETQLLSRLRPGQVQLEIGVQSVNPETIAAIKRRMDLDKVAAAVAKVREGRNIHQHLDLIAGLPYEGYESFRHSFDEVYRMKPDQLQLGFLKVLKGSAMAEVAEEHEIRFKSSPPYEVLSTKYLSYDDILKLKEIEEMVEVYYNSGQFLFSLPYLERFFTGPFAMFEALADYYHRHALFECRQNRMERYEILYRFVSTWAYEGGNKQKKFMPDHKNNEQNESTPNHKNNEQNESMPNHRRNMQEGEIACFAELLFLDICSRERIKSQPSFLQSRIEDKEIIRQILKASGVQKEQAGQYYVSHFRYDVLRASGTGEVVEKDGYMLFDYTKKNPLNGCCGMTTYGAEDGR